MSEKDSAVNLYGLRAGLSVISKEKDEVDKIEKKVKEVRQQREKEATDRQSAINDLKVTVSKAVETMKSITLHLTVLFVLFVVAIVGAFISGYFFLRVKSIYYSSFNMYGYICGAVFGVALLCIALTIFDWVVIMSDSFDFDGSGFIIYLSYILGIVCGIATIILFATNSKKHGVCYCGLLLGGLLFCVMSAFIVLICFMRKYNAKRSQKKGRQQAERQLQKNVEYDLNCREKDNEEWQKVSVWRVQSLRPHVQNVQNMYLLLRNAYQVVLDERDWKNLDLIIYELETRRADSIKEALQLVDRELQTQRLENLINGATKYIVSIMKEGFAMLQNTLVHVYSGISNQLSNISSQISSMNANLIASQRMNEALLAKANVSSGLLVEDLHAIRSNAEYMTSVIRRNELRG